MIGRLVFWYFVPWLLLIAFGVVQVAGWWLLLIPAGFIGLVVLAAMQGPGPTSRPDRRRAPRATRPGPLAPPDMASLDAQLADAPTVYDPPPPTGALPATAIWSSQVAGLARYRLSWRVDRRPSDPLLPDGGDRAV